ncbi:VanZ family protein [Streptomyces sp. bgisy095]|uniref:VanZ family protein n=1 Tax=unclassified Streptomyces TaxID=2593676 RepID=UPI003D72CD18
MFTAIFQNHLGYLTACSLTALVLGGATWFFVHRLAKPQGVWWAGLIATLTGVLGVTFMGGGPAGETCVINHQFAQPFHTTQGLWNLAMTVPLGLFAVLAVRRPLPVLVGVITLPLAIEFTQATVDGLGRVCDSSDAQMNILGGLLGVIAAAVALRTRRESLDWHAGAKPSLIAAAVILLAGTGLARPAVSFTNVDGTGLSTASADQRRAVEKAVNEAFGNRYVLAHVYDQPCVGAPCTNVLFTLLSRDENHPQVFGNGTLSWPDKNRLNIMLEDSGSPTVMGYPIPGAKRPVNDEDAYAIASAYIKDRYPWAVDATVHTTNPVGAQAGLGWITGWRWLNDDVLMPQTLDVQVGKTGTVSQVNVTRGPTRLELEKPELTAAQAEAAVREAMAEKNRASGQASPAGIQVKAFTLKAGDGQGAWRAEWLVNVSFDTGAEQAETMTESVADTWRVDAVTGKTYDGLGSLIISP